ncbi:MAG: ammonium transporter [Oscillospiraceae bacterium]
MEYSAVNTIWVLLGAALVFFMQAGFAMVETGLTRAKNAGNIIMKNLMDFCIGSIALWLFGFGLMFGGDGAIFGSINGIASEANYGAAMLPDGVPFWAYLIFQTVFAATAATIVSGAMAERTKFAAYCVYSAVISLLIYPISGHWIWGGGWLSQIGFHDFAGSTAVHMVGGMAALIGAAMLGPRIGKYTRNGKSKAIPGHSLPLAALGVFILWFSWFGFNGTSTVSMEGDAIFTASKIFVTTNIAAAASACAAMVVTWIRYKKPDVSMSLNGALAGLVAITAGCDTVSPVSAAIIGVLAGLAVVFFVEIMDNRLKIDDPVGAVSVHGFCGALGTICVGLFSDGTDTLYKGLLTGGGFGQLGIQALGVLAVGVYVSAASFILFQAIRKTCGLRVSAEEEMDGLDLHEHNLTSSYADFFSSDGVSAPIVNVPKIPAAKLDLSSAKSDNTPMSLVVIITRQNKLDALLNAMNSIGVTGVTITSVTGYGNQKGNTKYYRGSELEINLLPKVKVEIVVSTVPVSKVVATAEKVLFTGRYGDGKIFIYDVRQAIKVRTGEEGVAALIDTEAEAQA